MVALAGYAARLDHGAFRRQIAEENGQAAAGRVSTIAAADDFLIPDLGGCDALAQRPAGDGQAIKVEGVAITADLAQDGRDAPGAVDVFHVPVAGRADLADVRHAGGDFVDALQRVINPRFVGDGQSMQDGVGAAPHRHVQGERIIDGLGSDDLARGQIHVDEGHDLVGSLAGQDITLFGLRQGAAVVGQGEAQGFHQAVHAVGGEHPGAGAAGRAAVVLQRFQLGLINTTGLEGADAFEDTDQVDPAPVRGLASGHRAATDEDGRDVQPHGSHEHAGHDLVAVGDADHAVEGVSGDDRLHRVGDQLAAGQGVVHAQVAHGNAVIDADGVELEGDTARFPDGLLDERPELLEMDMAGDDVDVAVADGDEGLGHVLIADAGCLQQ